jgi:hypothetical protein
MQQEGAPVHYVLPVREYLKNIFSGRWNGFGYGGHGRLEVQTLQHAIVYVGTFKKQNISQLQLANVYDIKRDIGDYFNNIPFTAWRKMSKISLE